MKKLSLDKEPILGVLSIAATVFGVSQVKYGPPCLGTLFLILSTLPVGFVVAGIAIITREKPRSFVVFALIANVVTIAALFFRGWFEGH